MGTEKELPYFIESSENIEKWELDTYLSDRRKIYTEILNSNREIEILHLYKKCNVSTVSLAKAINELIEISAAIAVDKNTIELTATGKRILLRQRHNFFSPTLPKSWKVIPEKLILYNERKTENQNE